MDEIKNKNEETLSSAILNANTILTKSYLSQMNYAQIVESNIKNENSEEFLNTINQQVRFFDITQIVLSKNENMRDKLATVFNAVGCTGASVLMRIAGNKQKVSIQFGVKNIDTDKTDLSYEILSKSLSANFPGSLFTNYFKQDFKTEILDTFPKNCIISTITDIPALRYNEETKERQFMQGIEKLIDTMKGEKYTLLLIADPISLEDLTINRTALENIYSTLTPFSESQYTIGENSSISNSNSVNKTITENITKSVQHTVGKSKNINLNPGAIASAAGAIIGTAIAPGAGTIAGSMIGGTVGGVFSISKGTNDSNGYSTATSEGTTYSEGETQSVTIGKNESLQIKYEDHTIKQILKRIDETLKRYDTSADLGMWNFAVYSIAESEYISQMAASTYHSLLRGKNSSLENGAVTTWNYDQSKTIIEYLKNMSHPLLNIGGRELTPGTLISSSELAIASGLPNHSVPGIAVLECAEFGRTVSSYDNIEKSMPIHLGNIFNMHTPETLTVELDADSLSSHVFITGSTGSGKSNTVYQLLNNLKNNNKRKIKFLVIEPAKGEYKYVFGQDENNNSNCDIHVYGTNPAISELLRINPFSFPHENENPAQNIHILEHLDRLIEIFNVCWPMYAAMPAVLKEAVEKSYEDCGWNLTESTNEFGSNFYPTFNDVTRNITYIIDNSEYDNDNKGAYKGALTKRLKSLTNGINGLIFTKDEIANNFLFDENVIVDLSRVGSAETKSLIMGLLVLKLQEYRMTSIGMNSPLRHVTVLEEAHNLLKRTSIEQSQDSGNLLGKSVEMLTNSIAEMRTYGEGFIIADQAPSLLDMAVIRNTNTKIIMRLPDKDDRELVGKAANLNENQIIELAKLPRGVAAVYQNEWVEAVLCKIQHFSSDKTRYKYTPKKQEIKIIESIELYKLINQLCSSQPEMLDKEIIEQLECEDSLKVSLIKYLKNQKQKPDYNKLTPIVSRLLKDYVEELRGYTKDNPGNPKLWRTKIKTLIKNDIEAFKFEDNQKDKLLNSILHCLLQEIIINELKKPEYFEQLIS